MTVKLRPFIYTLVFVSFLSSAVTLLSVFPPPNDLKNNSMRDSTQIYLMSKAILDRSDPYRRISDLRGQFLSVEDKYQNHPSPYPLLLPIFVTPLSVLSIGAFSVVWAIIYVLILFFSICGLLKTFLSRSSPWGLGFLVTCLLLPSTPVSLGMKFGQVDPLLLFLFSSALARNEKRQFFASSIYLAMIACIKTLGAPFVISKLLSKEYRLGISLTLLVSTLLTLICIGHEGILDYVSRVTTEVVRYYLSFPQNLSLVSLANKLAVGVSLVDSNGQILPYVIQPAIAEKVFCLSLWALPILFTLACILLRNKENLAIVLFPFCIFCSPVLWSFYFILFIPLFLREILSNVSARWRSFALITFILVFYADLNTLAFSYSTHPSDVPFVPSNGSIVASMAPVFILMLFSVSVLVRDILNGSAEHPSV